MVTIAYFVYSALQLALFVFALRIFVKQRRAVDLFLCLSAAGLVFDNAIVGAGRFVGEGQTLMALNTVRFVLHALTTPLLAITGLAYARNALVEWTWTKRAQVTYCVIALLAIAYGLYADVFALRLEPATFAETLRYVNVGVKGPPLAAITTMTLLIFLGLSMFVKTRWPWLLVASVTMFTVAAFASSVGVVANLGEVLLIAGLVATSRRFPTMTREQFAASLVSLTPTQKMVLAEQIRDRKRKLAHVNRWMAWIMAPILVIGTLAYYQKGLGLNIASWVSPAFNNGFIVLFFIHAIASFYFYGVPKPKTNIRVAHVYIGYGVFIFTMISQSLLHIEPIHMITYGIMWVFIGAHLILSTRFMLKRVTKQRQDPMLDIAVGKKYAAGN
jgi:hypothetical protein